MAESGRTGVPAASTAASAAASTNSFSSVTTPARVPSRATAAASRQSPSTTPAASPEAGSSGAPSTQTLMPRGHAARQVIRASCPAPAMPTSYGRSDRATSVGFVALAVLAMGGTLPTAFPTGPPPIRPAGTGW